MIQGNAKDEFRAALSDEEFDRDRADKAWEALINSARKPGETDPAFQVITVLLGLADDHNPSPLNSAIKHGNLGTFGWLTQKIEQQLDGKKERLALVVDSTSRSDVTPLGEACRSIAMEYQKLQPNKERVSKLKIMATKLMHMGADIFDPGNLYSDTVRGKSETPIQLLLSGVDLRSSGDDKPSSDYRETIYEVIATAAKARQPLSR